MASRKFTWPALLATVAVVAAACSSAASPSPSSSSAAGASPGQASASPPQTLVKVNYGLPTATAFITTVGAYFALDNGFFQQQGLDVTITPYAGSPTATRALLSGDAQIIETGGDSAFLAYGSGAPIKIVYSPVDGQTGVIIANSQYSSLKDLAGKRFAISQPKDSVQEISSIELQKAGVDPNSMQWVPIGSPADRVTALLAGQVDATSATILVLKPVLDAIDAGQIKVLAEDAKEVPNVPLAYDITTDQYIKDHADVVQKFITAEMQGYRWAAENPAQAAAIAVKYIKNTPQDLLTRGMQGMAQLGVWGLDGGFKLDQIQATQDQLQKLGTIKTTVKPEDVADPSFIEKANQDLGPAPTPAPSS